MKFLLILLCFLVFSTLATNGAHIDTKRKSDVDLKKKLESILHDPIFLNLNDNEQSKLFEILYLIIDNQLGKAIDFKG